MLLCVIRTINITLYFISRKNITARALMYAQQLTCVRLNRNCAKRIAGVGTELIVGTRRRNGSLHFRNRADNDRITTKT